MNLVMTVMRVFCRFCYGEVLLMFIDYSVSCNIYSVYDFTTWHQCKSFNTITLCTAFV